MSPRFRLPPSARCASESCLMVPGHEKRGKQRRRRERPREERRRGEERRGEEKRGEEPATKGRKNEREGARKIPSRHTETSSIVSARLYLSFRHPRPPSLALAPSPDRSLWALFFAKSMVQGRRTGTLASPEGEGGPEALAPFPHAPSTRQLPASAQPSLRLGSMRAPAGRVPSSLSPFRESDPNLQIE